MRDKPTTGPLQVEDFLTCHVGSVVKYHYIIYFLYINVVFGILI